jgi:hypothetical protein
LAHCEEGFEEVVADREGHDEALPWEERAVEEPREALMVQASALSERSGIGMKGRGFT